jgi:2-amino-4-hydroxy-6-hydroxymethyldihydropteridine diphosphokinase
MKIAVGLGSSLGDRRAHLELAARRLAARPDIQALRGSRLYRTPPMRGGSARGWFLNAVVLYETTLEPHAFLSVCVALERNAGRRRSRHWGDRTLDLDVLLAGNFRIEDAQLTIPHPGIQRRPFVWIPLLEAWPDARDPHTGQLWADFPCPEGPRPTPAGVLAIHPPKR